MLGDCRLTVLVVEWALLIIDILQIYIFSVWFIIKEWLTKRNRPNVKDDYSGLVAIVTGGLGGIGREIVRNLIGRNVHVIIADVNEGGYPNLQEELLQQYPNAKVEFIPVNLESLKSVKAFAETFREKDLPIHLLFNNAGVMFRPQRLSEDGIDTMYQVNHFGAVYLTYLLRDILERSSQPSRKTRVVNTSSCLHLMSRPFTAGTLLNTHYEAVSPYSGYCESKFAIAAFSVALAGKWGNTVSVNYLHPGVVGTGLFQYDVVCRHLPTKLLSFLTPVTPLQASDHIIHVALSEELEGVGGKYFENCTQTPAHQALQDLDYVDALFEASCTRLGISDWKFGN